MERVNPQFHLRHWKQFAMSALLLKHGIWGHAHTTVAQRGGRRVGDKCKQGRGWGQSYVIFSSGYLGQTFKTSFLNHLQFLVKRKPTSRDLKIDFCSLFMCQNENEPAGVSIGLSWCFCNIATATGDEPTILWSLNRHLDDPNIVLVLSSWVA